MVFYVVDDGTVTYAGPVQGFTDYQHYQISAGRCQVQVAEGGWSTGHRRPRREVTGRDWWPVTWYGPGDDMIAVVCPD